MRLKDQTNLSNINFSSIHELQDGGEVVEWNIFKDDDGMLSRILLQKILEVWATGTKNHLVCLGVLTFSGNGHVAEGFLIPQMLEGGHHVSLEVVPAETELLTIHINHLWQSLRQRVL